MTRTMPRRGPAPLVLAILLAATLGGCGSAVDPGAFEKFAAAATDLRDRTDEILADQATQARDRFVQEIVAGNEISLDHVLALRLEPVPGQPYAWSSESGAPLFLAAERFRGRVAEVNDVLVRYAGLLVELAAAGTLDPDEFRTQASELDAGLNDAAGALLAADAPPGRFALFSAAATEAFASYLGHRSRDKLAEALTLNQGKIDTLSISMRQAMEIAARHAFAEYVPRADAMGSALVPGRGSAPKALADQVIEYIAFDQALTDRLAALQQLDGAYAALPAVNRELAAAATAQPGGLAAIGRIRDHVNRVRAIARELGAADAGADTPPAADQDKEP